MGTFVVGLLFAVALLWAGRKAQADIKKGRCGGCSACSHAKKDSGCQLEEDRESPLSK